MELRPTCLALIGFVLVACGTTTESEPEPGPSAVLSGTVVETDDGAVLCEGPVAESAPPQCEGPRLVAWEWPGAWSEHGTEGGRWGEFCFEGERNGSAVVSVTGDPRPAGTCELPEVTGHVSIIEEPDGDPYVCLSGYDAFVPHFCAEGERGGRDFRMPLAAWSWPEGSDIYESSGTRQAGFLVHGVIDSEGAFVLTRAPEPTSGGEPPPSSLRGCGMFAESSPEESEDGATPVSAARFEPGRLSIDPASCKDVPYDSPLRTAADEAEAHEEFVYHYLYDETLIVWLRVDDPALLPALQRVAGVDAVQVYASFTVVDSEES